jgi:hypothetical protein
VTHEAHLVGASSRDGLAGDQHLHRHGPRDLTGQTHRRPRHGEEPPLDLAHRDLGALGRHPHVERLEDLDAARVAVALHCGDDRRRRAEVLEEPLVDEGEVLADPLLELVLGGLARREGAHQAVEVGAGREVAAGAGHDRGAHVVLGVDHVPGVAQPAQHLGVEGVLLGRAVEGDGDDVAVTLDEDRGI